MARAINGDVVEVAASNNIFTALAGIGFLVTVIAFVVVFMRAAEVFPNGLMGK